MSTSYPFMAVARMRGLDYGLVLRIADHIEGKQKASQRDQDCCRMSDWKWIEATCDAERKRRRNAKDLPEIKQWDLPVNLYPKNHD